LIPLVPKILWYLRQLSIGCPRITKTRIAIQMTQIYQYQPTHRHNRISMHTISRKYPTIYSNILKAQKLKRITEDTMKIMG
jgi:hypothetical protein